jgi:hypothetical protein
MLVAGLQPVQQNMLFNKDTSFFAPGCRDRESGGSGAIGFGSVRGVGTGLFVGGSRFVESYGVYWAGRSTLWARGSCSACCSEPKDGASPRVVMSRTPR